MARHPALRMVEREVAVAARTWRGYVPFLFVQPVLFFGSLGLGVGRLVDQGPGALDIPYREFAAPGLLMATVMLQACGGSLWPITLGTTWHRMYHAIAASPLRPSDIYIGYVLWIAVRSMAAAGAFLIVAALLGGVPSAWAILAVPAAALCSFAFSGPVAAYAATQDTDSTYIVIMRLGAFPLFLFSGTTFPISELPGFLPQLALLSPLYHAVEIGRAATSGTWSNVVLAHAAFLAVVGCVGWLVGTRTMTKALAS